MIEPTSRSQTNATGDGTADLALLDRFIGTGDPTAFATIVERYGRVVFATALRILGDPGGAQDVSQETFYRLIRQPRAVQSSLAGWLHRSATHLALDVRRSETARRKRETTYGQDRPESGPQESTWAELSPWVDSALDELDEPARLLVVRHFLQGVRQDHLAAELNLSPATVSRRIKNALAELQQKLTARGIRLGAAALAIALFESSRANASAAFVSEMGKMQLVASLRAPSVKPGPTRVPSPFKFPTNQRPPLSCGQTKLVYTGCLALLAVMVSSVLLAWVRSQPSPRAVPPAPVGASMHDDR